MIPSQMLKGFLEGAILEIIRREETYGYEISKILLENGFGEISEGTIYPVILRLQKNKYVKGVLRESSIGPKRKYYSLTEEGKEYLREFRDNWGALSDAMEKLMGDKR